MEDLFSTVPEADPTQYAKDRRRERIKAFSTFEQKLRDTLLEPTGIMGPDNFWGYPNLLRNTEATWHDGTLFWFADYDIVEFEPFKHKIRLFIRPDQADNPGLPKVLERLKEYQVEVIEMVEGVFYKKNSYHDAELCPDP